jgi:L-cysteate sulfo-lyase
MPEERSKLSAKLARFPRLGLAQLPTPLEPMKRLTEHLGGPRLWVKREDETGFAFGGNKLRKLDYVLHEAVAVKADTLVSGGVVQSNSQRQVAAAAAKLGLQCHLAVYHGRVSPPTPEYETSGNAFLNRLFGAHLYDVAWNGDRNGAIQALGERLRQEGRRPYFIPYGASIALKRTRVVGIDIDAEPERVWVDVVRYANDAADLFDTSFNAADVEVIAGHAGPAYGVPHDATLEAIRLAGALEALVLDPVYSGKGLAGLIALVRAGRWQAEENVVFIHTGGAPALFAYRSALSI